MGAFLSLTINISLYSNKLFKYIELAFQLCGTIAGTILRINSDAMTEPIKTINLFNRVKQYSKSATSNMNDEILLNTGNYRVNIVSASFSSSTITKTGTQTFEISISKPETVSIILNGYITTTGDGEYFSDSESCDNPKYSNCSAEFDMGHSGLWKCICFGSSSVNTSSITITSLE